MRVRVLLILLAAFVWMAAISGAQPVDLNGVWRSNVGRTYEISQTRNVFTWKVPGSSQTGSGSINGLEVNASWTEGGQRGSAAGVVVLDPQGRAFRINWSNDVVFFRGEQEPPPPQKQPPRDTGRPPQEGPAPEGEIRIGGPWFGNNGLNYEFAQHGRGFEWHASDGTKGSGNFKGEMTVEMKYPDRPSVAGRVFVGQEPGLAAVIEWENGLVLTREPPAGQERPRPPEGIEPPRPEEHPERAERPEVVDMSGLWIGSNRVEVEVGQEGPEFVWREVKTDKTSRGRVEGERLWMGLVGDERRRVEGQILELDGPRALKIRWQDGQVFTRGEPSPAGEMVEAQKITPARLDVQILQAHLLKAKTYNVWVKMGGPLGGLGYDVRYSANTARGKRVVYVTDNYSGVNRSDDGGATWSDFNSGINGRSGTSGDAIPVFSLTVDPNDPGIVWCGLKDVSGIFKSTDGGKNWEDVSPSDSSNFVCRGITIMPGASNIVFVAGELPMKKQGKSFDRTKGLVYKTKDGGRRWSLIWEGQNLARYVYVDPRDHDIIYVSTGIFDREANNSDCTNSILDTSNLAGSYAYRGGVGVLKSNDGGQTWKTLGRANGLTDLYVGSLVMHPSNPKILMAGCGNNVASYYTQGGKRICLGGVFLTTNGGEEWTNTLVGEQITAVDFAWSNPKVAYAGSQHHFYRSQDGGLIWKLMNGSYSQPWGPPGIVSGFPIDILVDPENPNVLFVNNYGGGNVKSTDGGKTWTVASQGYTGALLFDVAIDPKNPEVVYTAGRSGSFRSKDGGRTWQGLSYPPALLSECSGIACRPGNSNIVLAAQDRRGDLYWSQNGGQNWSSAYQLQHDQDLNAAFGFKCIVFAPSNPQVVYGASCRTTAVLDTGLTSGLGAYKSTDGGKTWVEANNNATKQLSINSLAVHPTYPGIVYAATVTNGLCKTTDGGSNWARLTGLKPKDVRSVAIRPDKPDQIYAGINGGGGYFSPDGGQTWSAMASGMESNDSIYALVIDPVHPENVWAGSFKTGVYRHDPIEQSWVHYNKGLHMRAVTDLAISASGKVLYAATWGEGVFRLDLKPDGTK